MFPIKEAFTFHANCLPKPIFWKKKKKKKKKKSELKIRISIQHAKLIEALAAFPSIAYSFGMLKILMQEMYTISAATS